MARKLRKMKQSKPLCECGCGQQVKRSVVTGSWNNYLHGHNSRSSSNSGKFKSGNKCGKGRAEGSRNKVTIAAMNIISGEEEALSRRALESALNGITQMLQFCLSRILPPPPKDQIVKLNGMPVCKDIESSVALSSFVLKSLADGKLSPSQASLVSGIVEKHIRCLQVTDLEKRIAEIEETIETTAKR